MKHILIQTALKYFSNEADNQKLQQYERLRGESGWLFHAESLRYLQGLILEDLMSDKFTELPEREKDVKHRTLKSVYDVIEFLIDPPAVAKTVLKIKKINRELNTKYGVEPQKRPYPEATV